jgi:uncharacterized protein YdiU (UPF0061 family)
MTKPQPHKNAKTISSLDQLAKLANYSFMDSLNPDPDATENGVDHDPRQVYTGHYVPVKPTPIPEPEYISHSKNLFSELGFAPSMAESPDFVRLFSGDISQVPKPMSNVGWATGYALSIYGTEYIQQCPFQTGNGYGDGRAVSVLEVIINGQRWEMQLKGGGRTPYCRGADGRAVLRSSIREFLAQEHMHALGISTSRSLSLYTSKTETVQRPWYSEGSRSEDPDRLISEAVAISTRVAPSFIRVGQLELFARRTRKNEHSKAKDELEKIVLHLMDREYPNLNKTELPTSAKVILLAREFRSRLTALVANWIRVGFCQGNFNSDNCAAGGYTLDYGPFGFVDVFYPHYSPWTGGGHHFSFMNQPDAAQKNFDMFCSAIRELLKSQENYLTELNEIQSEFAKVMQAQMHKMWSTKLGLTALHSNSDQELCQALVSELQALMLQTPIDYTIFFRELSSIPENIEPLKQSFYKNLTQSTDSDEMNQHWTNWLAKWKDLINRSTNENSDSSLSTSEISKQMKLVNPKYILREWIVAPAYQQAAAGDYSLVRELQEVMTRPYDEQSAEVENKYYKLKPAEFFAVGGVSHLSCSS